MIRQVIQIDKTKCNGCGLCANACHEGAIAVIDGKATLVRDDYCDGMGDCLPSCPTGAITFITREADAYNEAAVIAAQMAKAKQEAHASMPATGCPGSAVKTFSRNPLNKDQTHQLNSMQTGSNADDYPFLAFQPSQLTNWPIQIKLAPINAPFFQNAKILIAADCCAYSYGAFHEEFIKGRTCLIGCPKLDGVNYTEKLQAVFTQNNVSEVVVTRMEVPCCGGLEYAVEAALDNAGALLGRKIPLRVVTITADGNLI